jgi:hypothetical protein
MFSEQPAEIKPAAVSVQAVQATVRASSFTASTGMLTVRVKFNATTDLLDNRGLLNEAIDVRVVDDEGVHLVQFEAGDPPLGCLLDVEMFSWSMLLSVIAATLAMIAWVRQSAAKAKAL